MQKEDNMKSEKIIWTIVIVVVAVFLLNSLFGMGRNYGMMGYGDGSMMAFGWLFGLLVTVALILLIVWLWQQIEDKNKKRK